MESVDVEKRRRTLTSLLVPRTTHGSNPYAKSNVQCYTDQNYGTEEKIKNMESSLQDAYTKCQNILEEMKSLSEQDKSGETTNQIQQTIDSHKPLLAHTSTAIYSLKGQATDGTRSVGSTRTRRTGSHALPHPPVVHE